jgi:hypothetical protein
MPVYTVHAPVANGADDFGRPTSSPSCATAFISGLRSLAIGLADLAPAVAGADRLDRRDDRGLIRNVGKLGVGSETRSCSSTWLLIAAGRASRPRACAAGQLSRRKWRQLDIVVAEDSGSRRAAVLRALDRASQSLASSTTS